MTGQYACDAQIVCVCLLQAIINEQRQVEVAKQIAEKQKVEQQKLKDLAVIDKLKELEVRAWHVLVALPRYTYGRTLFFSLSPSLPLTLSLFLSYWRVLFMYQLSNHGTRD